MRGNGGETSWPEGCAEEEVRVFMAAIVSDAPHAATREKTDARSFQGKLKSRPVHADVARITSHRVTPHTHALR
jgi:hypothetical protein